MTITLVEAKVLLAALKGEPLSPENFLQRVALAQALVMFLALPPGQPNQSKTSEPDNQDGVLGLIPVQ